MDSEFQIWVVLHVGVSPTTTIFGVTDSETSGKSVRAFYSLQLKIPVKGFKVSAVLQRLPSRVAQAPAHFELKISAIPSMAQQLVHKPFIILWHPEVVWLWVYSIWK